MRNGVLYSLAPDLSVRGVVTLAAGLSPWLMSANISAGEICGGWGRAKGFIGSSL